MTTHQQWEYCELILYRWEEKKHKWFYDLAIRYFSDQGGYYYTLSEIEGKNARAYPYNPWVAAIGFLGMAEWELVSVQHANAYPGHSMTAGGWVIQDNVVAYFKRPVRPGRRVDEPKLVLP